jgi:DNA-binding MarR family transcriptional regulator
VDDLSSADFDPLTEPRIVALLRMAHEMAQAALYSRTASAGYAELRPAHFRLLRFPGIDGVRPTALAERLETTKQAINPLLNDLEGWGYIERRPDPEDGRGRVLWLTPRGHALMSSIRQLHAEIEADWGHRIGAKRFQVLRAALRDIARDHPVIANMSIAARPDQVAGE